MNVIVLLKFSQGNGTTTATATGAADMLPKFRMCSFKLSFNNLHITKQTPISLI
jgi:hypothetical protein